MVMKVLVVGTGGREHALCWRLRTCPSVKELYCAPGNPGTAEVATNIPIAVDQIDALCKWALENKIDLTIAGPEYPLTLGLADKFIAAGLTIFGPTKAGAEIEGSKGFAKDVMVAAGVPTADYKRCRGLAEAQTFLAKVGAPIVIKEDGLAAGKGVFVCMQQSEIDQAVQAIFAKSKNADVVIEKFIVGKEASFIVACNENCVIPLAASNDYKRIGDNDTGPNTGGMGTVSPTPNLSAKEEVWVLEKVVRPVLAELKKRGISYRGFLYPGLIRSADGTINVLEFNARLGDPETQVLMRRCETNAQSDLARTLYQLARGEEAQDLAWKAEAAICVVLAAQGYPADPQKGDEIKGLKEAAAIKGVEVFHAGTALRGQSIVTSGGRVLNVTAMASDLNAARALAYQAAERIHFSGRQFRSDIGLTRK